RFDIREMLQIHPFCACSFTLARSDYWEQLPLRLSSSIENGLRAYRQTFLSLKDTVIPMLEEFETTTNEEAISKAAANLKQMLNTGELRQLNTDELQVLHRVFEHSNASDLVIEVSPTSVQIMNDDPLSLN